MVRMKEPLIKRVNPQNVRRLARWLNLDPNQPIELVIEDLRGIISAGYFTPSSPRWGEVPTGFRGVVH